MSNRSARNRVTSIESLECRTLLTSQTFSNPGSISINDSFSPPTTADPYPSSIDVSGVSGSISGLTVQLKNFSHDSPADVDVLLVNAAGSSIILMSDAGANFSVSNRLLTFNDSGARLPDLSQISSGTYRPTNRDDGSNDDFPDAPGGGSPTGSTLSDLSGDDPDGTWQLYVVDDQITNAGSIGAGWSITIDTQAAAPAPPSTPDLIAASDTGISSTDNITRSITPTFAGTAEPNSTVTIYSDGSSIGSAAATAGGDYSVATSGLTDGSHSITATATGATGTSSPSGALLITVDTAAPSIVARAFNYFSNHNLTYDFSETLGTAPTTTDLTLKNLTQNTTVPPAAMHVNFDGSINRATITFPGLSNSLLSDGNYRSTLGTANIADVAGNSLAAIDVSDFFVLSADANHDRHVDTADFTILANSFNQSGKTFDQGDFNYDGKVNALDFNALATRYGTTLPAPPLSAPILFSQSAAAPRAVANLFSSKMVTASVRYFVIQ